ncbi:MAG: RagB/SusD family nutrient uptake outer membrane protein [Fermentimonas sp.]|nr:RagB/SusD family nutrient uptake outer membrane protein [Fermentimonas sp.]MDD3510744.1 RagB/SusD family nutrient uptake outer membrane protein [Fermentimonas sp.]MDD4284890.1 RagB/SusD family nutrient uptake outer membrane protein [Fermentimonas sp.]MDD4724718.1 RagB/SusD family nutrient uptake outer membrane protein [Fermentimonas sp.]
MKIKYIYLLIALMIVGLFTSCNEDDWLQRTPKDRITDEQLWNDPNMILGLLANYYDRLPQLAGVFNTGTNAEFDDAMWSGHVDQNWRNDIHYGDDYARYWDYTFIRHINLSLENLDEYSVKLSDAQKKQFNAELRFIRAYVYFEMVKRMGGVPLITSQLIYDGSGDPSSLQIPRAKESEVYDFIYSEIQEIKDNLTETVGSRTRANKITALALQSRAMLYAGSIAKYNSLMSSPISTTGGEVGIPANMANDYYQKSLSASEEIIADPEYELYNPAGSAKGENFYKLFFDKSAKEVIFAKDFMTGKVHGFTYDNVVRSFRTDIEGSSILTPSLSLVESFEYLDGSKGTLKDKDAQGNYITYTNMADIFANKDARLYGTVVYPGSQFRNMPVNMQAGVAIWEDGEYTFKVGNLGTTYEDGGILTGFDGPRNDDQYVSNTGFYLRKFVSENPQDGVRPSLASNWWTWFRLGEIYLNAGEAAFELGQTAKALNYINEVREAHGGFPANSLTELTIETIQNERRVELAFEDHRFFDLKRWRIADKVWNGLETDANAVVHGLYPYRVIRPGHPDDGKYIFDRMRPTRFKRARFFRMANYYSSIDPSVLNNNPKLVKNPFH